MDTQELRKQINDIYIIISSLKVSGDAVDVVAAVRAKLRKLDEGIGALTKEADESGGQGDR